MSKNCDHILGLMNYEYDGYEKVESSDSDIHKNKQRSIYEAFNYCPLCGEKLELKL